MNDGALPVMTNNIVRGNEMQWRNPRLFYLRTITKALPTTCPECDHELTTDDDETYCTHCGLVTSTSIEYVAGIKINLPYGRH